MISFHFPRRIAAPLLLVLFTATAHAGDPDLVRGEDYVQAPAVGEGLSLSNLFQSGMVLQRDKPIRMWGWAAQAGDAVTVRFAGQEQSVTAGADRGWSVTLEPLAANASPQALVVAGDGEELTLGDILIGDVWVLGGQSNMEFEIAKVENGNLEIAAAHHPNLRMLSIPAEAGPEPHRGIRSVYQWSDWSKRHFRKGYWDTCTPETVRELSAIGYVFAKYIHQAAQVPVGVIDTSRGGTTVETWTPLPVLRGIDAPEVQALLAEWDEKVAAFDPQADLERRVQKHHEWVERMKKQERDIPADRKVPTEVEAGPIANHNYPGSCYAGMIAPLEGLSVKGAIFHQGYNNCFNGDEGARMYAQVFPEMIAAWRTAFNDPGMPFGILSLCTSNNMQQPDNYCEMMYDVGVLLREAQYRTYVDLLEAGDENIGFVSTYDLNRRWYHPQLKIPAGVRAARWALATEYGFDRELRWEPPMLQEMQVEEGQLLLTFNTAVNAVDHGGPIEGFSIAGEDRAFHPATAKHLVTGKDSRGRDQKDTRKLVLTSSMVPKPIHYRYAWARNPMGNLQVQGNTDVPFATQRSDDWGLNEAPLGATDKEGRAATGEVKRALREQDRQRALQAARALLEPVSE